METQPRQAIDLAAMMSDLRRGWVYLVTIPAFVGLVVFFIFRIGGDQYSATATLALSPSAYARVNSSEFLTLQPSIDEASGLVEAAVVSSPTDAGIVQVSFKTSTAELAHEYWRNLSQAILSLQATVPDDFVDTAAEREIRSNIQIHNEYADGLKKGLSTIIAYASDTEVSGKEIGAAMEVYRVMLEKLRTNSIFLHEQNEQMRQTSEDLHSLRTQVRFSVMPTSKYRFLPIFIAGTFGSFMIVAALILARTSIRRSFERRQPQTTAPSSGA